MLITFTFSILIFTDHDRWILLVSPQRFTEDLTFQRVDVHGVLLQQQHRKSATFNCHQGRLLEPKTHQMSYLVDVLQQIQSLFEVVLVGSSVVVADVQLWRADREQRLSTYWSIPPAEH